MRGVQISLLALFALAGCDSLNKPKVDNPVMGPPPPRMSFNNSDASEATAEKNAVQTADAKGEVPALDDSEVTPASLESVDNNNSLSDSQTVAVVNGSPILASEVLERYGVQLAEAKKKLPPEQYEEARRMLIQRDLDSHIERKLLADGLKAMLKKEQIEMLENFINEAFDEEVERMMKEAGVSSRLELERELRKQHTTLANLKTNFANQRMAMEFLGSKAQSDENIGRREMLQYYKDHRKDYHLPARVKWQQIVVNFRKHGGRAKAEKRLEKIIEKLRPTKGANFTEVAKDMSDGPNADNGGRWEWTKKDSLADQRIARALFELPPGQPSQVFEDADAFKIVRVDQREDSRYKPFNEVQDEIKESLQKQSRQAAARQFIDDLMTSAEITTIFDDEKNRQAEADDALPLRIR